MLVQICGGFQVVCKSHWVQVVALCWDVDWAVGLVFQCGCVTVCLRVDGNMCSLPLPVGAGFRRALAEAGRARVCVVCRNVATRSAEVPLKVRVCASACVAREFSLDVTSAQCVRPDLCVVLATCHVVAVYMWLFLWHVGLLCCSPLAPVHGAR